MTTYFTRVLVAGRLPFERYITAATEDIARRDTAAQYMDETGVRNGLVVSVHRALPIFGDGETA